MNEQAMTVLVVGAGKTGAEVLRQLLKNPGLRILTLDTRDSPYAIEEGIIRNVDFKEPLTPLSIDSIIKSARPDLVLLTTSPRDMGLGEAAGIDVLSDALQDELATIADVPVIKVARLAS
jgi:nucleoside-diphosphate-sugar epimerase